MLIIADDLSPELKKFMFSILQEIQKMASAFNGEFDAGAAVDGEVVREYDDSEYDHLPD